MSDQPQDLAALDNDRRALAQAQDLHEVKTFRDKFEAARAYARSAAMGLEAQNRAAEMKLRAERKAGELLTAMRLHGGDRRSRRRARLRLEKCGISHGQSHRWQLEALVPEDEFEHYLSATRQSGKRSAATVSSSWRASWPLNVARPMRRSRFPASQIVQRLEELAGQGLTFGCIYVDPFWPAGGRPRLKHRQAASSIVRQLLSMPVRRLAKPEAHVHLWTTDEYLFDARRVLSAWGFAHLCVAGVDQAVSFLRRVLAVSPRDPPPGSARRAAVSRQQPDELDPGQCRPRRPQARRDSSTPRMRQPRPVPGAVWPNGRGPAGPCSTARNPLEFEGQPPPSASPTSWRSALRRPPWPTRQ